MRHFALALCGFLAGAAFAEDAVDLKIKMIKGQSWKVELSAEMVGTGGESEKEAGVGRPLVRNSWTLKEAWTDACEAEADGGPSALRRTWTSAKIGIGRGGGDAAGQEGVTAKLESKGKEPGCTVTVAKGKLPSPVEDMLARGPIEPLVLLLPAAAVKPGEEWKVTKAQVCQFHRLMAAGLVGGGSLTNFDGLLRDMKNGGPAAHGCDVTAKITAVTKTDATIEFAGVVEDGNGKLEVKGTLKWILAKGRPSDLTWSSTREVRANEELRLKTWNEEWKFTKSWK